jgi:phospholipid/cholesterol/gamma-HCH transport system substrate-binding protein
MADQPEKQGSNPQDGASPGGFSLLPRSLGVKVGMLLGLSIIVAAGFIIYALYARGLFEQTQRLYLITDNAEGIAVGSDLSFAGFPIGRVRRIRLMDDGRVRISVRVPVDDAKWLRQSSVFVIDVPIVGAAKLRAYTADLKAEPLPDRAERPVLRGDTAQEIPKMVATLRSVLENFEQMTDANSSLQQSLGNVRTMTERMAGKYGVLGGALGGEDNAKKLLVTIDRANALLASLGGVSLKLDSVLAKTDQKILGQGGVVDETQKAVQQANAILAEVGASLKRVDRILADAEIVAGNAKTATADLGNLRAEVEASLRKVAALIDEINRKWPFERDTKIKLP